jgi:hypothetical protein
MTVLFGNENSCVSLFPFLLFPYCLGSLTQLLEVTISSLFVLFHAPKILSYASVYFKFFIVATDHIMKIPLCFLFSKFLDEYLLKFYFSIFIDIITFFFHLLIYLFFAYCLTVVEIVIMLWLQPEQRHRL